MKLIKIIGSIFGLMLILLLIFIWYLNMLSKGSEAQALNDISHQRLLLDKLDTKGDDIHWVESLKGSSKLTERALIMSISYQQKLELTVFCGIGLTLINAIAIFFATGKYLKQTRGW